LRDYQEWLPIIRQFADRGFRWLLEAPENARGLVSVVAADLCEHLDFARMIREPVTFIAADLHQREADLVLRIPYRQAEGPVPREVLYRFQLEMVSSGVQKSLLLRGRRQRPPHSKSIISN
jgi:hypothetical protein